MKKKLKVFFLDWYEWILPNSSHNNIFLWFLQKHFDVEIDNVNPDVLFYSLAYSDHLRYKNCIKIYVIGEPGYYSDVRKYHISDRRMVNAIEDCDFMFTSYDVESTTLMNGEKTKKNFYFPIFHLWLYHHIYVTNLIPSYDYLTTNRDLTEKNKFCIFLHNNNTAEKRNQIFNKLNSVKPVDTRQNFPHQGYNSEWKIRGLNGYKFSFAMQNHFYLDVDKHMRTEPGLIDEKIIESFISNTIPLYYGNDKIKNFFNEESFLNLHDFNSDEEFVDEILKLDKNYDLLSYKLNQPIIKNIEDLGLQKIEDFLINKINELL